jgi:hypothetical protein
VAAGTLVVPVGPRVLLLVEGSSISLMTCTRYDIFCQLPQSKLMEGFQREKSSVPMFYIQLRNVFQLRSLLGALS